MNDSLVITLNNGQPLLPKQQRLMQSRALVNAAFGGWGSGKTRGSILAFLANCIRNPWTPAYGDDRPFSLIVAPTHKVLKDSAYREFRAVCPKEIILREWKSPDWEILLANGHVIKMRTVRGSLEGASAVSILVDEIHMVPDEKVWLNYQARARDPRASNRMVIASGLPESGWLQTVFDGHEDDSNRMTVFMSSTENSYLPREVVEQFRRSAPGKAAQKYIDGKWMTSDDRVYYEFDPTKHLIDRPGDKNQFVHIGMDIGDQSVAVFAQETRVQCKDEYGRMTNQRGIHIVDEFKLLHKSTEAVCRAIRDRGWKIDNQSCLLVDPTIRRDEIDAIRKVFPRINMIRKSRKGNAMKTEPGHSAVNAALCDADGNIRLTFDKNSPRDVGSLYHSILNFKRGKYGTPVRNDRVDHFNDALRYIVAHFLPVMRSGHQVMPRIG